MKLTVSPLKMMVSNRNLLFQGSFSGDMLVLGRVAAVCFFLGSVASFACLDFRLRTELRTG